MKENTSDNRNKIVHEASYTYINSGSGDKLICVVSDSVDKKVQIDKKIEYYQIENMSGSIKTVESFLTNSIDSLLFLKEKPDFLAKHKDYLNNYMYGLLYQVACLNTYMSSYKVLYDGPLYESILMKRPALSSIKYEFIKKLNEFYKDGKFIYKNRLMNIKNDYEKKIDPLGHKGFEQFDTLLNELEDLVGRMRDSLKKQYDIEDWSLDNRSYVYFHEHKFEIKDKQVPEIERIIKNEMFFNSIFWMRRCYKSFVFVDQYMKNLLSNEKIDEVKRAFDSAFKEYKKESDIYIRLYKYLNCLYSNTPETYYNQLINDEIFKSLSSDGIFSLKSEFERLIEELEKCNNQEDKYFKRDLYFMKVAISYTTKLWKETLDDETNGSIFILNDSETIITNEN